MKAQSSGDHKSWMTVLTAVLVLAVSSWAQDAIGFMTLKKHINQQVTVETPDGPVSGQLLRVEENRLVVYKTSGPQSIARDLVKKVTKHKSRHTLAWVTGMSAAGLGTGFLLGMRAFDDTRDANSKIATLTAVQGGVGAAVGCGLSRIGKRDEVLYQQE
jgi:hypothetical protein